MCVKIDRGSVCVCVEIEREMESVCREREGVCFEIEGVCREIESVCKGSGRECVCLEKEREG